MPKKYYYSIRMRSEHEGVHISGAEGIYDRKDIPSVVRDYTKRALYHDRGISDNISIRVEELKIKPEKISSLPLSTARTRNADSAKMTAAKILTSAGITERAVREAIKAIEAGITVRGAMLMDIEGVRLEPDLMRGVRVTRMGISRRASSELSRKLGRLGLNNSTVKEALILASKVHKYPMVLGELCISDDPNYTTGYAATLTHGYVRLPRIKKRGSSSGGRAFFIAGGEVKELIRYLQRKPVMVDKIRACSGELNINEILSHKSRRAHKY